MKQLSKKKVGVTLLTIIVFSFLTGIITVIEVPADVETGTYGNKLETYISFSQEYGGKVKLTASGATFGDLRISMPGGAGLSLNIPVYNIYSMVAKISYKRNGYLHTTSRVWTRKGEMTHDIEVAIPEGTTDVSVEGTATYEKCITVSLAAILGLPRYTSISLIDSHGVGNTDDTKEGDPIIPTPTPKPTSTRSSSNSKPKKYKRKWVTHVNFRGVKTRYRKKYLNPAWVRWKAKQREMRNLR